MVGRESCDLFSRVCTDGQPVGIFGALLGKRIHYMRIDLPYHGKTQWKHVDTFTV